MKMEFKMLMKTEYFLVGNDIEDGENHNKEWGQNEDQEDACKGRGLNYEIYFNWLF